MDIDFELYKFFYHTAREGSFSMAAKKLYVSQSAVSQAVKNLEEKIGGSLFFRKTRNIKLTPEGELLFSHVEQAYNFIKSAENKISEMKNLEYGEIRLGVSDTICKHFIIPHLEGFYNLYPRIKIQVVNRTSSQILAALKTGQIDLGIITLPVNDPQVYAEEFIKVRDIFVASDRFSFLKNKKIGIHELSKYPLLMLPQNSATRQNIDLYLRSAGVEISPEIELESIDLLVEFSRIGLGIACVLRESAEFAIEKGELFEVKTKEKLPDRIQGIITMRDVPLSHAAGEFIKFLKG